MPARRRSPSRLALLLALAALTGAAPALAQEKPEREKPAREKPAARDGKDRKPDARAKPAEKDTGNPAAAATLVATFSDWSAYTAASSGRKICYALSEPKSRSPSNLKDTKAYLFVSIRPSENVKNELASVLNFDTKDGAAATMGVGSTSYDLVTKGKNAWIKSEAEEGTAIATMSKGTTVTVQATSAKGNKTSDRYSLSGFAQAFERARRDCGGAPGSASAAPIR